MNWNYLVLECNTKLMKYFSMGCPDISMVLQKDGKHECHYRECETPSDVHLHLRHWRWKSRKTLDTEIKILAPQSNAILASAPQVPVSQGLSASYNAKEILDGEIGPDVSTLLSNSMLFGLTSPLPKGPQTCDTSLTLSFCCEELQSLDFGTNFCQRLEARRPVSMSYTSGCDEDRTSCAPYQPVARSLVHESENLSNPDPPHRTKVSTTAQVVTETPILTNSMTNPFTPNHTNSTEQPTSHARTKSHLNQDLFNMPEFSSTYIAQAPLIRASPKAETIRGNVTTPREAPKTKSFPEAEAAANSPPSISPPIRAISQTATPNTIPSPISVLNTAPNEPVSPLNQLSFLMGVMPSGVQNPTAGAPSLNPRPALSPPSSPLYALVVACLLLHALVLSPPCVRCQTPVDQCQDNLCANGATCVDRGYDYTCDCSTAQDFTGWYCNVTVSQHKWQEKLAFSVSET